MVIPAKAGIQVVSSSAPATPNWAPACAGATKLAYVIAAHSGSLSEQA